MSTAKDPEQIQREIEETRRELGDTVEALAAKADVKALAHEKIGRAKASVARPAVLVPVLVCVGALVAWRLIRRG